MLLRDLLKRGKMKSALSKDIDLMSKHAMLSKPSIISADHPQCDVMSKHAMRQQGAEYCPNCSNRWNMFECYQCGYTRY